VLTSLNLYGNDIGPEGGKAIADALKSGTSVLKNANKHATRREMVSKHRRSRRRTKREPRGC